MFLFEFGYVIKYVLMGLCKYDKFGRLSKYLEVYSCLENF